MTNRESPNPGPPSSESEPPERVPGLTNARGISLERFLIRTRASSSTQSGWRLLTDSDQGGGAIVFVEISGNETFHRGEGVFLGWPPERLAAAYEALRPEPEHDGFEMQQMG
jgi:hypothetical protein